MHPLKMRKIPKKAWNSEGFHVFLVFYTPKNAFHPLIFVENYAPVPTSSRERGRQPYKFGSATVQNQTSQDWSMIRTRLWRPRLVGFIEVFTVGSTLLSFKPPFIHSLHSGCSLNIISWGWEVKKRSDFWGNNNPRFFIYEPFFNFEIGLGYSKGPQTLKKYS